MEIRNLSAVRAGRTARWAALFATLAIAALVSTSSASAAKTSPPAGSSDLAITKVDSPDPARVGSPLTYSIGVENRGPAPATGVTVTDKLPKGVTLVSATGTSGPCSARGQSITCSIGNLARVGIVYGGSPRAVTIVVTPRKAGTIQNTATVKGDQKDPVGANNKATASTRVLAPATCLGFVANVTGTAGDDVLLGTPGSDVIVARAGNDRVFSLSGRDLVCAGPGQDIVGAGPAADRVLGAGGADRLFGRGGPDVLRGAVGNDVLRGGRGSDRLRGGFGFDRCRGGPGADSLRGCER